jgi:hypothetical protein
VSERVQIVLTDPAAARLRDLATFAGQPPSTLAANLIGQALDRTAEDHNAPATTHAAVALSQTATPGRPSWLEPYGGDPDWRAEMWTQIVALHGRYPRHLAHLKDRWWEDESHTETLCALALWRAQLDEAGTNPREELDFQGELANYAQILRAEGGGVSKAWQPGAPPPQWQQASAT